MTIREIKLNSIASNEPLVFKWSSNPQVLIESNFEFNFKT